MRLEAELLASEAGRGILTGEVRSTVHCKRGLGGRGLVRPEAELLASEAGRGFLTGEARSRGGGVWPVRPEATFLVDGPEAGFFSLKGLNADILANKVGGEPFSRRGW